MDSIDRTRLDSHDDETGRTQRETSRDSLLLIASLSLADETARHEVRVRNLSEGGLMIEFDRPLAVGATVALALRGIGDVTGRVAWCTEGRVGIALDQQIDPRLARKSIGGGRRSPTYAKPWNG